MNRLFQSGLPVYPSPDGTRGTPVVWIDPTTDAPVVPSALVGSAVSAAVPAAVAAAVPPAVAAAVPGAVSSAMAALATVQDTVQLVAPATGSTVAPIANVTVLLLNAPALIAALTVQLPAAPKDGQRWLVATANTVTLLTVTGGNIKGTLTTLVAGGYARFIYSAAAAAWFRVG